MCVLTVLARELTAQRCYIGVHTLRLLVRECWQVIPVSLEGVGNVVCCLWVSQLEDGVVVECPVLRLLVLAPDLLAFNAEDLHADASWCGEIVGKNLWCEGRVAHDDIVGAGLLEHSLGEMSWEVVVYDELAHDTLYLRVSFVPGRNCAEQDLRPVF
jgi:hypothetical protein